MESISRRSGACGLKTATILAEIRLGYQEEVFSDVPGPFDREAAFAWTRRHGQQTLLQLVG